LEDCWWHRSGSSPSDVITAVWPFNGFCFALALKHTKPAESVHCE
jgi:hypothetical protein